MGMFSKLLLAGAPLLPLAATAQQVAGPTNVGPYNAAFLEGGIGIDRPLERAEALVAAGAPYTISAWVKPEARQPGEAVLVALGDPTAACRCLSLDDGRLSLRDGDARVSARTAIAAGRWTHVAAVSDGSTVTLYIDGKRAGGGSAKAARLPSI